MLDWQSEARPILVATYNQFITERYATSHTVAKALGRDDVEHVGRVMSYLASAGYLTVEDEITQTSAVIAISVESLEERALQELAGWPVPGAGSDVARQFVEAIDDLMVTATPDERTRLQKLRQAALGIGNNVLTKVLTDVFTKGLPDI